jgi:pyruvate dehydrogenase E1 component
MNENYSHPAMPKDAQQAILKGMYLLQSGGQGKVRVNLLGSGTILREVIKAAQILESDYGVPADIFSVPSYSELRREALEIERRNVLHPDAPVQQPYVRQCFGDRTGPFIAASDYMKIVPDQIRQWVPGRFIVLGTDGYGRSDSRAQLRRHFEVDHQHIVVASLRSLADEGKLDMATVKSCIEKFGIDPDKPSPVTQ